MDADQARNRLLLTLSGTITKAEAEALLVDLDHALEKLQPDFDVVNDLREFQIGHIAAAAVMKKIIVSLQKHQVDRVVRISGESKTALNQFARVTDHIQDYAPILVSSREEAEEFLNPPRPNPDPKQRNEGPC